MSAGSDRPANRLAREKSPYLLQHAHNPVDWRPWGDEAFDTARREDKPVFLSIGYSTCHWCHVMERESFESDDVARIMNEGFVSIKVDREERPDVDQVYMAAVHALGQQGGWPLSVWLTPDRKPFFGGTYFPPDDRWGRPGFVSVLRRIRELWTTERTKLAETGQALVEHLSGEGASSAGDLTPAIFDTALRQIEQGYDPEHGGFGSAPKFPRSVLLDLLLRLHARTKEPKALGMVEAQLRGMMRGGIYDHLGGGFARYSTDAEWLAPHFEKMLYDNALLMRAYTQAWQVTKNADYARIVRETAAYVKRDMTSPEGAFYSAEDADSEGFEGTFYLWTPEKVKALLPAKAAELFCSAYGVVPDGNFFPHEEREPRGNSILHIASDVAALAKQFKRPEDGLRSSLAESRRILFEARAKRVRPHRDDKVLLGWNGLMISALSFAGAALDEKEFVAAAERAALFALDRLRKEGRMLRRYRDGESAHLAGLDDYASFIDGLIELYQATFKVEYIEEASRLAAAMLDLFGDPAGGFFSTGKDQEALIARLKETYDGATPSGGAEAVHVLLRLASLTGVDRYRAAAEAALKSMASELSLRPHAYPHWVSGFDMLLGPSREIVVAGDAPDLLRAIRSRYLRNTVIASADPGAERLLPLVKDRGRPGVHVCRDGACRLPVTGVKELERELQ